MGGRHRAPAPARREARARLPRPGRPVLLRAGAGLACTAMIVTAATAMGGDGDPAPPPAATGTPEQRLQAGFDALPLSVPTGVAIVPVGGGTPILLGDRPAQAAWSTIKAPLALAAERDGHAGPTEERAVIDSDNRSARVLTTRLGTPDESVRKVTAVLREGGDERTVLPTPEGDEHPHLGDTVWSLTDSAVWTAHLPCLPGSDHVLDLMRRVSKVQNWGLKKISGHDVAVKGGWGEEADGGYLVRQIGVLTLPDGGRVAIALSAHAPRMRFETGVADLDTVGRWLGQHLDLLPGGHCPAAATSQRGEPR